jgi:hypothetical protein
VVNWRVNVQSDARGTSVALVRYDIDGKPPAPALHACVTGVIDGAKLPQIARFGRLEVSYPITFAVAPPDNRDLKLFDEANRAAAAGDWRQALEAAEQGLEITSLDGQHRRRLIEVAGVAACHLGLGAKAQHYIELASPRVEPVVRETCKQAGTALPPNKSATH